MKRKAMLAVLVGVLASCTLYTIWFFMQGREQGAAQTPQVVEAQPADAPVVQSGTPSSQFLMSGAVSIDARLGTAYLQRGIAGQTYVSVMATTGANAGLVRLPANVTLVIDRSGSMQGSRIQQAKAAAGFVLDNMQDGDRFSLVTYSSDSMVDISSTVVNPTSRARIKQTIENLNVGGGTCVSCGLESGRLQAKSADFGDGVSRIILFSDGQANSGITDSDQLGTLARSIEQQGVTVTTIGVGLDYNEELMSQIAVSGNGNHYFVEDPASLSTTLASEMSTLRELVAKQVTVAFRLGDGVSFVKGFDRDFKVEGNVVVASLGDLPAFSQRTVLFQISTAPSAGETRAITFISVDYMDIKAGAQRRLDGSLVAALTDDSTLIEKGLDSQVVARVEQAALADALTEANKQLGEGRVEAAQKTMATQLQKSRSLNKGLKNDVLDKQLNAFGAAEAQMATPAAMSDSGRKKSSKENQVLKRELSY